MHTYYRHVKCTSSVMQALALFKEKYPWHRKDEIDQCIRGATEFIEKLQNDDGSWSVLLYMTIERFQFGTFSPYWIA
jgi:squalene cyclase